MEVNSTVNIDFGKIEGLKEAVSVALAKTAEALHTEVVQAQVMPYVTGNLQNESTFVDDSNVKNGEVSVVSDTPYARRLYYHPEYHFSKDENPNARGKWFTDWTEGGSKADFAKNAFAEFYRQETGV